MPRANLLALARQRQPLERILAHQLQHREARLAADTFAPPHEALVDERRQSLEHGAVAVADGLGRRERAAAPEDAEPREKPLHRGLEEVVAPVERRAQG